MIKQAPADLWPVLRTLLQQAAVADRLLELDLLRRFDGTIDFVDPFGSKIAFVTRSEDIVSARGNDLVGVRPLVGVGG